MKNSIKTSYAPNKTDVNYTSNKIATDYEKNNSLINYFENKVKTSYNKNFVKVKTIEWTLYGFYIDDDYFEPNYVEGDNW